MSKITVDLSKYLVEPGSSFSLADRSTNDTQGLTDKKAVERQFKENRRALREWQTRLFAEGKQAVLLVLQAMDTAGKDSTIRQVTRGINPQGTSVVGFKSPTTHELARDYLWRVHHAVPRKGHFGIFNRSHYEDVLIVRVHGWASPEVIEQRYEHINDFERLLTESGTRIVKVMLHISKAYQKKRLVRRLERPDKHWKFNPSDLKERALWDKYMDCYEKAMQRCSTDIAPWYVIPAEERWFRDLAISQLVLETFEAVNPQYPDPEFDPAEYPADSII